MDKDKLLLFKKIPADSYYDEHKYSLAIVEGNAIQLVKNQNKVPPNSSTSIYLINDRNRQLTFRWGTIEEGSFSSHGSCTIRIDNPARLMAKFRHDEDDFQLYHLRKRLNQYITVQLKKSEDENKILDNLNQFTNSFGVSFLEMVKEN